MVHSVAKGALGLRGENLTVLMGRAIPYGTRQNQEDIGKIMRQKEQAVL